MKYIVSSEEMNLIDKMGVEDYSIPSLILMESAASKCYEYFNQNYDIKEEIFLIFIAKGNNGGDGLALARLLALNGARVKLISIYNNPPTSKDFQINLDMVNSLDIDIYHNPSSKLLEALIDASSLIVDSLIGTGLSRDLDSKLISLVNLINNSNKPIISIDIPTGINSNSGRIMGAAIRADKTLTFEYLKLGHLIYPGRKYTGQVKTFKISLPKDLHKKLGVKSFTLSKADAGKLIYKREKNSHKGSHGKLGIIAGSPGLTGAAYLTAQAAHRSGSGLTSLFIPSSLNEIMESKLTEVMTIPVEDHGLSIFTETGLDKVIKNLKAKDVCSLGPGIGTDKRTSQFIYQLLENIELPLLVDADGLNILADKLELLKSYDYPKILTPHPGEMSRLLDQNLTSILDDPITAALELTKRTNSIVVLKGSTSIVTSPDGDIYFNTTGNPGMASAGTGDVLTGIITSLLGQGYKPYIAAVLGVFIHGHAGDLASRDLGEYGLVASDLIDYLPLAFKSLSK